MYEYGHVGPSGFREENVSIEIYTSAAMWWLKYVLGLHFDLE